jgi:ATP-dependent Clp protease ATP-binding subunit ClpA
MFDSSLQEALHKATQYTRQEKNEFVTLEHFIWACLSVKPVIELFKELGEDPEKIRKDLEAFISRMHPKIDRLGSNYNPEPTLGLHRSIDRALKQAQSSGKQVITALHVVLAIFEEEESYALFSLEKTGLSPIIIMEQISSEGQNSGQDSSGEASTKDPLKQYCENLNLKFQKGEITNLVGRQKELDRVLEVLSRKNKNNPLLVGDPGVGKTALGESLAELIETDRAPEKFKDLTVFSLDLTALLAGSKYRGDFENRLKQLFKSLREIKNPLLFIDEVHSIVGAGSTSGSNVDFASLLKPVLTDSHLKVLGSTTYAEYRKNFAKDAALSRRFQPIFVEEPSKKETLEILKGSVKSYEDFHSVKIEADAVEAAVDQAELHILDRKFPDKAFDVLDETCAHESTLKKNFVIKREHILKTLNRVYKVSEKATASSSDQKIINLEEALSEKIFGQDEAIAELSANLMLSYSGLGPKGKPLGAFLFTGPTGVGKTELSRQLALHMNVPLVKFDMSEYMEKHSVSRLIGAPPGYVGHDEGGRLTDEVSKTPHCILLLDEIEKAHPDVINILLQVMDSGELTDSIGKKTHFTQCTIIMTSNSGAREAEKGSMGIFEASSHDFSDKALKEFFSPEFLNRLTSIVKFNSLSKEQLKSVVEKNLKTLKEDLIYRKTHLEWDSSIVEWVLKDGAEKGMGARPFERFINKNIRVALAKKLIEKDPKDELKLKISYDGSKLVLK